MKTNGKVKEILRRLSVNIYFLYAISPEPPTNSRIISGLSFIFINVWISVIIKLKDINAIVIDYNKNLKVGLCLNHVINNTASRITR